MNRRYNSTVKQPKITYPPFIVTLFRPIIWLYNKTHWFTDKEAWALFRFFAIGEAIGWTALILAIVYRSFDLPGADIAVSLAGRFHGAVFTLYFLFVLLTARSMMWGFWTVVTALIAGMPPYTSLLFEQFMAYTRKKKPVRVAPPAGAMD